jgi:hypothetical protein
MTHFQTGKLKPIRWAIRSNLVKVTRWLRDSRKLILTVKQMRFLKD